MAAGQEIFVINASSQTSFRQRYLIDNRNILNGDLRPGEKQKADRFLVRFYLDKSAVSIYKKFMPDEEWQRSRNPARLLSIRTGKYQRYAVVLQQLIRFPDRLRFQQKM